MPHDCRQDGSAANDGRSARQAQLGGPRIEVSLSGAPRARRGCLGARDSRAGAACVTDRTTRYPMLEAILCATPAAYHNATALAGSDGLGGRVV